MLLSGPIGLDSVYYKDLGTSAFPSYNLYVDRKRNRVIKFTVGDGNNVSLGFNVVLALYDLNAENEDKIIYDKTLYTNEYRGLVNQHYYDEELGIIYAQVQVADSITGVTHSTGFSGQLCKLEIDFDNVSNTTIELIVDNDVETSIGGFTTIFYASEIDQVYYFANSAGLYKRSMVDGSTLESFTGLGVNGNTRFRTIAFDKKKEIYYAAVGEYQPTNKFYKVDFKNSTLFIGANTAPTFAISPAARIINDNLFEIYTILNDGTLNRILYDFDLNIISQLPVGLDGVLTKNGVIVLSKGELFILQLFRYFRKVVEIQTDKTIPLLSGSIVSGDQSNKSVILQNDL